MNERLQEQLIHFASTDFFCNSTPKFFNLVNGIFKDFGLWHINCKIVFSGGDFHEEIGGGYKP